MPAQSAFHRPWSPLFTSSPGSLGRRLATWSSLCLLTLAAQAAPKLQVVPDVDSGVYEPGKPVTWSVSITDENKTPEALEGDLQFKVLRGGLTEIASGTNQLHLGKSKISATRTDPGTLLVQVQYQPAGADKPLKAYGGAVFAPGKITRSQAAPDDFDAFWKSKITELQAIPMTVQWEKVDVGSTNVEYFKITLANIHGTKIQGQLAKPVGQTNLPALLQVQWAGVYPLNRDWVLGHARAGWLALNISAHDLPIDEQPPFYAEKSKNELNDYPGIGNEDRESSYFLRMFLSCHRAVEYLTQHPDWNKKTLVVHGGSQGGYQAIVTAGLHPAVTAFAASVPAGCDHTGKLAGRAPGWPNWASRTWQKKDEKKMTETARYFDAMNFASRIQCPGLVGLGLADTVCPSEGIFATCNQIKDPLQLIIMPQADHQGDHKAYNQALNLFLQRQKQRHSVNEGN